VRVFNLHFLLGTDQITTYLEPNKMVEQLVLAAYTVRPEKNDVVVVNFVNAKTPPSAGFQAV